jgi:hypothetical protein
LCHPSQRTRVTLAIEVNATVNGSVNRALRSPFTFRPTGIPGHLLPLHKTGGSAPDNFLGGPGPKKWGRSRPFWWFFHSDFCPHRFAISHASKKLLWPQAEELGEDAAEACSSYTLHSFPAGSCAGIPTRRSTSVAKCALTSCLLPPNSWTILDSVTLPAFHPRYKYSKRCPVKRILA